LRPSVPEALAHFGPDAQVHAANLKRWEISGLPIGIQADQLLAVCHQKGWKDATLSHQFVKGAYRTIVIASARRPPQDLLALRTSTGALCPCPIAPMEGEDVTLVPPFPSGCQSSPLYLPWRGRTTTPSSVPLYP
jgi:hypothetical protein